MPGTVRISACFGRGLAPIAQLRVRLCSTALKAGHRSAGLTVHLGWCGTLTARANVATIGAMGGIIERLDEWGEARPWLTAVCAGLVLAAILTTITLFLDDSPDW